MAQSDLLEIIADLAERVRHLETVEEHDVDAGAPAHSAAEGRQYWDRASDKLYINADGATTWTLIGGGEGVGIPIGCIVMWSGEVEDIPTDWRLCDGKGGTPDLRDRFVVGVGSSYSPDDTGGNDSIDFSHTHGPGTLSTDNDTHDHGPGTLSTDNDTHSHDLLSPGSDDVGGGSGHGTTTDSDTHSHSVTGGTTANDTHGHSVTGGVTANGLGVTDIRPSYYALCYIMRIS